MTIIATSAPGQHNLETNNIDRVDFQRGERIEYKDEALAPIMAYFDRQGSQKSSKSDRILLFRGDLMSRRFQLTDAAPAGGTAGDSAVDQSISSVENLVAGMTALVHGGIAAEGNLAGTLIRIDSVAATEINYTNLSGGTIAQNDFMVPIGFASAENATVGPDFTDREPETVNAFLTILKLKIQVSITERDTAIYAAENREQEKIKRTRLEFMRHREANAWFSRATTNVGSTAVRTSMGIHEQLAAGITFIDAGAAPLADFMLGNALATGAKFFDTDTFACFHGQNGLAGLFKLGAGKLETRFGDNRYGFKAQMIDVSTYTMAMVYSQLFDLAEEPFLSLMVGLDLSSVTNWVMKGEGKMQLKKKTDPKAQDEGEVVSHMWRTQEGVSLNVLERHWAIENLLLPVS